MDNIRLKLVTIKPFKVIGTAADCLEDPGHNRFEEKCEKVWKKFIFDKKAEKIPQKQEKRLYGVYFNYNKQLQTFKDYLVGCKVDLQTPVPEGLQAIAILGGSYLKLTASENVPECHTEYWDTIDKSNLNRTFATDFEVYDEAIKHWRSAQLDVYIGLNLKE